MKTDYPEANARLAEVAKSWAEGEVSHDVWRKERHTIISTVWSKKSDWQSTQNSTLPIKKKAVAPPSSTMPNIDVSSPLTDVSGVSVFKEETVVSHEDALLLAILLLSMLFIAVVLLYWV